MAAHGEGAATPIRAAGLVPAGKEEAEGRVEKTHLILGMGGSYPRKLLDPQMPGGSTGHMLSSCQVAPVGWDTLTIPSPKVGFPGGSVVKNLAMQEMQVLTLGREDPLEKGMATHSSILA